MVSRFAAFFLALGVPFCAGRALAQVGVYGHACSVTALVPTLALQAGSPRIGSTFVLIADAMAPTTPVTFWLGSSRTAWGGMPLPIALHILGRPDCSIFAAPEVLSTVPQTQYRQALLSVGVPNDRALVGQVAYGQAANFLTGWDWMFTPGVTIQILP